MAQRGGKRDGAGRKSKAEELGLSELMDSIGPTTEVLQAVYTLALGMKGDKKKGIKEKAPNTEAQKIWLSYKFGKPKESVTITDNSIVWIEEEHGNTDTQTA
jgi:hypothetical protein